MTPKETAFLFSALTPDTIMLEWGSGDGTYELRSRVRTLVSIEHDKTWFDKLSVKSLHAVYHCPPDDPAYDESRHGDGALWQFWSYVSAPTLSSVHFDVILIDGRARVACAAVCPLITHPKSIVFIHDWGATDRRRDYTRALETLQLKKTVETLAMFSMKEVAK